MLRMFKGRIEIIYPHYEILALFTIFCELFNPDFEDYFFQYNYDEKRPITLPD
jgi:hypothetical protein